MSTIGAKLGYGGKVELSADGTVYTPLVGVQDFDIPTIEAEDVDVTHHGSPNGYREYIQGLKEGGTAEVPILYVPGSPTDVLISGYLASGADIFVRFTPPGAAAADAIEFRGYVKSYGRGIPVGGAMTATLRIKLSAAVEAAA